MSTVLVESISDGKVEITVIDDNSQVNVYPNGVSVEEAPIDGKTYGRKDGDWIEVIFENENIPITIPIDESILQGVTVIYNGDYYKTINDVDANFTPADHPELFNAFVYGDDARLTDARTPTAHKSTHATGGTDALSPSDIGAKADFTVNADTTPVDTDEVISQRGGSWLRTTYTNFKVFLAAWLLLGIKTTKIYPAVDGTTAVQFKKANDGTLIFSIDTTNGSILASGATPDASYFLNIPSLNILSNICVAIALRGNSLNTKDTNTDLYITTRTVGRKVYTDRHFESITAKIGSSTNNSEFEADGTLKMNGDATVWDDLDFPLIIKTTGAGLPARTLISGNVYGYTYAVNDSLDIDSTELAHKFKQGATTGKFHVHIVTNGVDASNRYVRFNFEYLAANMNGVMTGATVGAVDLLIPANTPDRTHLIFDIGDYTTLNIGSQIVGKFSRVAAIGTAPTNNPFVLKLQLHAEIDTIGSRQITTK